MNKFSEMSQEQFDALVRSEVEKHLSSKEEAEARKEAEEALNEAREIFETLKASNEAKDVKIKELEEVLANLDLDPTAAEVAANERVVEIESQLSTWKQRAEVAEAALETLAREETASTRMAELEEAGIALEGDDAEVQYVKVRAMTDEDFESYKSELTALKSKYASAPEGDGEEEAEENLELSSDEISEIAKSLGCDPTDSKCISLVGEVAAKMAEVSKNRKAKKVEDAGIEKKVEVADEVVETPEDAPAKETASVKLSLSEAITRAINQDVVVSSSLREELAQAWEDRYAEKRAEKKSS